MDTTTTPTAGTTPGNPQQARKPGADLDLPPNCGRRVTLVKIGRRSFVTSDSLDAYIDRLATKADADAEGVEESEKAGLDARPAPLKPFPPTHERKKL